MNGLEPMGKWLMVTGAALIVVGGAVWLFSRVDFLGRLPGDIRIEGKDFTCLIPLASSILLSILLTIVLNIVIRLLNR
jgi:hypothetical protein